MAAANTVGGQPPPKPPVPAPVTPTLSTPPAKPTFGDVWAFRAYVVIFFLTLIIGLVSYILSWFKYRS